MLAPPAGPSPLQVEDAPREGPLVERSVSLKPSRGPENNPRLASRMPELDGLRAIAVLLVLVYHFFVRSPVLAPDYLRGLRTGFTLGWSGVDLFLVLSGFLIGGTLVDARRSASYFKTFYARRVFRIFPLYYLFFFCCLAYLFVKPQSSAIPLWSYAIFAQNLFIAATGDYGLWWMSPTWSLAVEEQFYLLAPLFIRFLPARVLTVLLSALVVLAPVFRSRQAIRGQYVLLHCRADALALGILIALLVRNDKAWRWLARNRHSLNMTLAIGAVAMAWLTIYLLRHEDSAFGYSFIALFYGCVLLKAVVQPEGLSGRIFRAKVLQRIGRLSFFIYVVHQAVVGIICAIAFGNRAIVPSPGASFALIAVAVAVIWVLSELSWRYFEGPLIKRAHARHSY